MRETDRCNHDACRMAFCPHCGEPSRETTLDALYRHVHSTTEAVKVRLRDAQHRLANCREPAAIVRGERNVMLAGRRYDKWLSWDNALKEIVARVRPVEHEPVDMEEIQRVLAGVEK